MKLFDKNAFEKRIHEIDLFRGFLIFLVMFDHLLWFINFYITKHNSDFLNWYWTSNTRYIVRQIVLCAFMFTCGLSCHFSRNNKKRGLLLLGLALGVTIVTHLLQLLPMFGDRVIAIDFNILGVIALSILMYCLAEKVSTRDLWYIVAVLMLFYFFIVLSSKTPDLEYHPLKSIFYSYINPIKTGHVGDYLPLFPYVIFLFFGVIFARNFYKERVSLFKRKSNWERPICFFGRHTLLIYIAHEVVFTLIFMLIGAIID